jgi:flagellar protein FliL
MRKLFPILLAILGLGAGAGAGLALRPAPDPALEEAAAEAHPEEPEVPPEYVKLNNQFVVPVVEEGQVVAMVVLSLSLEVTAGSAEAVFAKEPKLRDIFLQVLFDHANAGGFKGSFTDGSNMVMLRRALLETASAAMGEMVKDVLIVDIARQDA